jgi:D-3-phosphoglycerate dehydrogenase
MKILITDKVHGLLVDGLKNDGHEVIYDTKVGMNELPALLPSLDGIVINSKIIMDRNMIILGTNLKFIARLGSGMEIIDVKYAVANGIKCINTPDGNCDAVAEHAIGMLLAFANNLCRSNTEVKAMIWNREANRGFELLGKKIGIIGVGHTGTALAKKLKGFGMNIYGYDKYKLDFGQEMAHVKVSTLDEIQSECDIISFHLPLSNDTRYLVDSRFLASCKKNPIIINTSRGNVIKTNDLLAALQKSELKGALLDVFENEKTDTYDHKEVELYKQLFAMQNVFVTPHVAGWTKESLSRIGQLTLDRIRQTL